MSQEPFAHSHAKIGARVTSIARSSLGFGGNVHTYVPCETWFLFDVNIALSIWY